MFYKEVGDDNVKDNGTPKDETGEDNSRSKKTYFYCTNCGTKLGVNAKFCSECGSSVMADGENEQYVNDYKEESFGFNDRHNKTEETKVFNYKKIKSNTGEENSRTRKEEYAGKIIKCPSCGEILSGFVAICPACGLEIRETKATSAVHEFAFRLEQIEAKKMPTFEGKSSIMKTLLGRDLKSEDEESAVRRAFERNKAKEIENLIRNFTIPNTKEDIYEFAILAITNIETGDENADIWFAKLEQAHKKSKIVFGDSYEFTQIDKLYQEAIENKKTKVHLKLRRSLFCGVICIVGIIMAILGNFLGEQTGDSNSSFYMMGVMGLIVMMGGGILYLLPQDKGK